MFAFDMFMSLCVDVMMMSSAYVVSFTGACGWCWSVRCLCLKVWVIGRRLVEHHF